MSGWSKWLVSACCLFGAAAGGYHGYLLAYPKKVLVVVDSSYPMLAVWDRVPPLLRSLSGARYTRYALATDKGLVHGWQPTLALGPTKPYAPRQLADLPQRLRLPEQGQAGEILLVTNADEPEQPTGGGWEVVKIVP
jgi:hypothetical protein